MAPRNAPVEPALSPSPKSVLASIDEVGSALTDWASGVVRGGSVHFDALPLEASTLRVNFFLADLEPVRFPRGLRSEPPLRAVATYLVSVWAPDIKEVNRLTSELLFSAMEQQHFSAVNSGATLWRTLGFAPHPSFVVKVNFERTRAAAPSAPAVRAVHLDTAPSRMLQGAVRGPDKIPIPDALVEIPALNLNTRTDHRGLFTLGAVTAGPGLLTIRLTAKGAQREIKAKLPRFPAPLILDLLDLNL